PGRLHPARSCGPRREMTRVGSGAGLSVLAMAVVWAAPDWLFFTAALLIVVLGSRELAALARASALDVSDLPSLVAAALAMAALGAPGSSAQPVEVALMAGRPCVRPAALRAAGGGGPAALLG